MVGDGGGFTLVFCGEFDVFGDDGGERVRTRGWNTSKHDEYDCEKTKHGNRGYMDAR